MTYSFRCRNRSESLYDALTEDAFYGAMENTVPGSKNCRREAMLRDYDGSMRSARKYGDLHETGKQGISVSIGSGPVNGKV